MAADFLRKTILEIKNLWIQAKYSNKCQTEKITNTVEYRNIYPYVTVPLVGINNIDIEKSLNNRTLK